MPASVACCLSHCSLRFVATEAWPVAATGYQLNGELDLYEGAHCPLPTLAIFL